MFSGYKTYIVAALIAGASFANSVGLIDDGAYQALLGLLGALGLGTLRAGVAKSDLTRGR